MSVQFSPLLAFARALRTTRASDCGPLRPAVCDGGFLDDRDVPIVTIGPFVALDQALDQNGRVMFLSDIHAATLTPQLVQRSSKKGDASR